MNESAQVFPARWVLGRGGGSAEAGIWAAVIAKESIEVFDDEGELANIRGKYTCVEIEWFSDGTWQFKPEGRTFPNCYEASTSSNANIQRTRTNVVHLFRISPVLESSSSSSLVSSSSSSSSSSANIDERLYVFDKALGNISKPTRV